MYHGGGVKYIMCLEVDKLGGYLKFAQQQSIKFATHSYMAIMAIATSIPFLLILLC